MASRDEAEHAVAWLADRGVLPARLLVAEVAGEPVRGSWWGHPRSHAIYAAATAVEDHPDTLPTRLDGGRVAWVHRRLWGAVLAVADAGERGALPAGAAALLAEVERVGVFEPARLALEAAGAILPAPRRRGGPG